jgi:hypothetical protein
MCKSFETSLSTFVFSFVCISISINIFKTKEVYFASIFILTFSLMQLIDAGIWWSLRNDKNKQLNIILSWYAIPIVLSLELLVSYFGIKYTFGWSNYYFEYGLIIFVTYILFFWIFNFCNRNSKNTYTFATLPYTDGYLHWCGVNIYPIIRILFILFLLFPVVFGIPKNYTLFKYIIILPLLISFIINYFNVTFGARWCWSSNIASVFLLLYTIYMKFM